MAPFWSNDARGDHDLPAVQACDERFDGVDGLRGVDVVEDQEPVGVLLEPAEDGGVLVVLLAEPVFREIKGLAQVREIRVEVVRRTGRCEEERGEVVGVPPSVLHGEPGLADAAHAGDGLRLDDGGGAGLAQVRFEPGEVVVAAFEEIAEGRERQVARRAGRVEEFLDAAADVEKGGAQGIGGELGEGRGDRSGGLKRGERRESGRGGVTVECAEQRNPEHGESVAHRGEDAGQFLVDDETRGEEVGGDEEHGDTGVVDGAEDFLVPGSAGGEFAVVPVADALVPTVGGKDLAEPVEPRLILVAVAHEGVSAVGIGAGIGAHGVANARVGGGGGRKRGRNGGRREARWVGTVGVIAAGTNEGVNFCPLPSGHHGWIRMMMGRCATAPIRVVL